MSCFLNLSKVKSAISVAALAIGLASPVAAAPIIDQDNLQNVNVIANLGFHSNGFFIERSQTFTVGVTGILSRIELRVYNDRGNAVDPLIVDIRKMDGGVPSTPNTGPNILESFSFDAASVSTSQTNVIGIDLAGISVTAGDMLAIGVRTTGPTEFQYNWWASNFDGYADGSGYNRVLEAYHWAFNPAAQDYSFRTFVTVSEPAAAIFLLLGTIGVVGFSRSRRGRN